MSKNPARKRILAVAFLLTGMLGSAVPTLAQLPVARPAAMILRTVKGAGGFTGMGVPFTQEPVARAVVVSVADNNINAQGTPFGAANYTSAPHSIVIVTGPNRGKAIRITGNSSSSVTVASTPPALVSNSDEFLVIPDWTLDSFYGAAANPAGLASNALPALADIVYTDNDAGSLLQYYHNGVEWRRAGGPARNANSISLGVNGGSLVLKRSSGDINSPVEGVLRSGRQSVTLNTGFNTATYTEVAGATLGTSGLIPNVLESNSDSNLADLVYLSNSDGALVAYFHNGTEWRRVGGGTENQNGVALRPETVLIINKRSSGSVEWRIDETFVP